MIFVKILSLLIVSASLLIYVSSDRIADYFAKRSLITKAETQQILGENNTLTDKERLANYCLMLHKFSETDYAFNNPSYYNFSHHYFEYKDRMRQSGLYKILKHMPKGAALHLHDMALIGPDYLLNITYMDHLYFCKDKDFLRMKFSNTVPEEYSNRCYWQLMRDARDESKNVTEFDNEVRKHFTLVVDNPNIIYPSITETWSAFTKYFRTVEQILTYRPVWGRYFYDALKKFREDNILYVEVRSILPPLYERNGMVYDQLITAKSYKKAISKFVKDYPDFVGAKVIFAPSRLVNRTKVQDYINLARRIKENIPEIFAGFDLVGQEDLGMPLVYFVPELLAAGEDLNYFFHAGETDWYGTTTDENLIDAVLLGTKRIGHAYALTKHPEIMKEVKEKEIGLEVNLISNSVLSLVRDVRNHPLSVFLANSLPVVISSDDPGAWEAEPLTDDFYIAFVAASSRLSDLRLLKQLAVNSLKYSVLDENSKRDAMERFEAKWDRFVSEFDCDSY